MRLYHFTTRDCIRPIRASGLNRGTVHLSATTELNAVWLTTDPGSRGHGLEGGGRFMTDEERHEAREWAGQVPPPGARFPKVANVRITVDLDSDDRALQEWLPWARRHLDFDWMTALHPVASGTLQKAKTWRLYLGVIPPERLVAIDSLDEVEIEPAPLLEEPRPLAGS